MTVDDEHWMRRALTYARQGGAEGEVPVGAVVVADGAVLGAGYNRPIGNADPTAHAEIVALREAAQSVSNYRLAGATLYVTLEPCMMCAGAIVHSRIERLVFGATEPKAGTVTSHPLLDSEWLNHEVAVTGGVLAAECGAVLSEFFAARRAAGKREASL